MLYPVSSKLIHLAINHCAKRTYYKTAFHHQYNIILPSNLKKDILRPLSTSGKEETNNGVCLYRRSAKRSWFPRGLLTFTTLHTGYWTWYIYDFVPAVAAAAAPSAIQVDSTVGYVGWVLSAFMWGFSCMYPKYLVSEIHLNKNHELLVKTHQLPFVITSNKTTTYSSLALDSNVDADKILSTFAGDMTQMRGHLGIKITDEKYTSPNLLLHLTENANEEILNNDLLLQTLLFSPTKSPMLQHQRHTKKNPENSSVKEQSKNRKIQRLKRRQNMLQRKK